MCECFVCILYAHHVCTAPGQREQREQLLEPGLERSRARLPLTPHPVGATGYLAMWTWDII